MTVGPAVFRLVDCFYLCDTVFCLIDCYRWCVMTKFGFKSWRWSGSRISNIGLSNTFWWSKLKTMKLWRHVIQSSMPPVSITWSCPVVNVSALRCDGIVWNVDQRKGTNQWFELTYCLTCKYQKRCVLGKFYFTESWLKEVIQWSSNVPLNHLLPVLCQTMTIWLEME